MESAKRSALLGGGGVRGPKAYWLTAGWSPLSNSCTASASGPTATVARCLPRLAASGCAGMRQVVRGESLRICARLHACRGSNDAQAADALMLLMLMLLLMLLLLLLLLLMLMLMLLMQTLFLHAEMTARDLLQTRCNAVHVGGAVQCMLVVQCRVGGEVQCSVGGGAVHGGGAVQCMLVV